MTLAPEAPAPATSTSHLRRFGDRVAVLAADDAGLPAITYRELADRVDELAGRLGGAARLVLLPARNDVETLVAYLAALAGRHPVILTAPDVGHVDALVAAYDPDVVLHPGAGGTRIEARREVTAHDLHPELAQLLSTSGSTGSPKLVRLSHENLAANAASIAEYLDIRETDCAATTLPMHYCYGLSVVNSHLLRGASLLMTERSVVDPCFWQRFREARATSFAAVPYTFDLLDRIGFADLDLPQLRYLTQAGGRLSPDRVRTYARLGQRRGWDLVVMYGQTEATARMAYLPPDLATTYPHAIGRAVPGGELRLRPVAGCEDLTAGELVYSGPNVMLGYAETPADLALGRTVHELATGDLARPAGAADQGLFELLGRLDRHAKVFGLRVDLDRVERILADHGVTAVVAAAGDRLVVAVRVAAPRLARSDSLRARAAFRRARSWCCRWSSCPGPRTGSRTIVPSHAWRGRLSTRRSHPPSAPRPGRASRLRR